MFDGAYSPTLAGGEADLVFTTIVADRYYHRQSSASDDTFTATIRALIAPRIKETDDRCGVRLVRAAYDMIMFKERNEREVAKHQYNWLPVASLSIVYANDLIPSSKKPFFTSIGNQFLSVEPGFDELKDLEEFTAQLGQTMLFFINRDSNRSVVFIEDLNLRTLHFLQSLISRILPWYFENDPLTDKERELVKSLTKDTPDEYLRLIEEFAKEYDFRSMKLERLLGGFEKKVKECRLSDVEASLENLENDIITNINAYRRLLNSREEKIIEQEGLKAQIKKCGQGSEVLDYFKTNKNLDLVDVYQDSISFIVSCYLENFDCDMYERYSNNFESYMYDSYEYTVTNPVFDDIEDRKKFLDAIFSDEPLFKVKICALYSISLRGWVETEQSYDFPSIYNDRIPNPHLHYYSCLGDQKPLIEEALRGGDTVGAIEQCVCSARSINIGENVTVKYLLAKLFSAEANKFIELPDGTSCTPSEALHWLKNYNKNTEVSN